MSVTENEEKLKSDEFRARRFPFVAVPLAWLVLEPGELKVALALGGYADREGQAWPSLATLAGDTGLSRNTVRTAIARLTERGVIAVTPRTHANGRTRSSLYVIDLTGESLMGGSKSDPTPQGEGAKIDPTEGSKSDPTEGSKIDPDLDPEKNQIHVEPDPLTPPTPSLSVVEGGANGSPAAPIPDPLEARFSLPPWLNSHRRIDPGFITYVARFMPKERKTPEEIEFNAAQFIRKADRVVGRVDEVYDHWERYQSEQQRRGLDAQDRERLDQERQWREALAKASQM